MVAINAVAAHPIQPSTLHAVGMSNNEDVVYDIVASVGLPVIDISRSVRTVLFSNSLVTRFDRIVAASRVPLFIMSNIAIVMAGTTLLHSVALGRWLACPVFLISLPAPFVQVMFMRYEIVVRLVRTYDFWFFSLAWLVSMALFMLCIADVRAVVTFGMWFGMQTSIMVDASTYLRESVWLTTAGLIVSVLMMAAIAVDALTDVRDFDLFVVNGYVVSALTVVLHGWSTCLLVLVRNVYRRRAAIRDRGKHNSTVVQCLSYRCRVRLRARGRRRRSGHGFSGVSSTLSSVDSIGASTMARPTAAYFANAKMVQMRCMRVKFTISPRNLVARAAARLLEYSRKDRTVVIVRTVLILLMETGAILTSVSFLPGIPTDCRIASLVTTALFCTLSGGMLHRQLLQYVVLSFDFAFLSFQLTVMHLALCDLYRWDSRAFAIVAVWLWFHWVLTYDCMPPVLKTRMRFRYRFVVLIGVQFVLAHICLLYQLVFLDRDAFRDRAILHLHVAGSTVEVRVLPLLVSRMLMTFCWSCRIVRRLLQRNENELVIIQGTVTYVNNRRKLKKREAEFLADCKIAQATRNMTRRMSEFAAGTSNAVTPFSPPLSVETECAVLEQISPPQRNARFVKIASQVYDATRVLASVQQPWVDTASVQPTLSQIVSNPHRTRAAVSMESTVTVTPLDDVPQ